MYKRQRINSVVGVLNNFKALREEGRSRQDYVDRLLRDLCEYYGYNDFMIEKLFDIFGTKEVWFVFEWQRCEGSRML